MDYMSKNWNTYYFLFLKFKEHFDTAVYMLKLFKPQITKENYYYNTIIKIIKNQ